MPANGRWDLIRRLKVKKCYELKCLKWVGELESQGDQFVCMRRPEMMRNLCMAFHRSSTVTMVEHWWFPSLGMWHCIGG